jgi:DNA-binding PadR family transcriptional regulator
MPIPRISHLQFVVLDALRTGERSGRELRTILAGYGVRTSLPAFYQAMARLEDHGMVSGRYEPKVVAGQTCRERRYQITGPGRSAWKTVRDFYITLLRLDQSYLKV